MAPDVVLAYDVVPTTGVHYDAGLHRPRNSCRVDLLHTIAERPINMITSAQSLEVVLRHGRRWTAANASETVPLLAIMVVLSSIKHMQNITFN